MVGGGGERRTYLLTNSRICYLGCLVLCVTLVARVLVAMVIRGFCVIESFLNFSATFVNTLPLWSRNNYDGRDLDSKKIREILFE